MEQIQAEYKVLALQCHPDKNNGDKEAEAKFQALKVCASVCVCVCVNGECVGAVTFVFS